MEIGQSEVKEMTYKEYKGLCLKYFGDDAKNHLITCMFCDDNASYAVDDNLFVCESHKGSVAKIYKVTSIDSMDIMDVYKH